MSKKRRVSVKENNRELRGQTGENGHRLCRWCKKEVQPPRRTFCSDSCVHEWRLRSDTGYLREHVYKRDLGICNKCKSDTRYQKIQLENILRECSYDTKDPKYKGVLVSLKLTVHEAQKSLWQADHIIPVAKDGGLCDLSNIQTLCTSCHKGKTFKQATSNAKPKKLKLLKIQGVKPLGLKGLSGKIED